MKKILCAGLMLLAANSYAGNLSYNFVQDVAVAGPEWLGVISPLVAKLFLAFWVLYTGWEFLSKKMWAIGDIKELFRWVLVKMLFMAFFTAILSNPKFYLSITQIFTTTGIKLMGSAAGTNGQGTLGLDPGWIWNQFSQWWEHDYPDALARIGGVGGLRHIGQQIGMAIGAMTYFFSSVYISFQIILMDIELTLIIYGTSILTCCVASEWTRGYWNDYVRMCVGLGLKIFLFCLLYGVMYKNLIYHAGTTDSPEVWTMIVNTILATLTLGVVPGRIAGAISSAGGGSAAGEVVGAFIGAVSGASMVASGTHAVGGALGKGAKIGGGMAWKGLDKASSVLSGGAVNGRSAVKAMSSTQPAANKAQKAAFMNDK